MTILHHSPLGFFRGFAYRAIKCDGKKKGDSSLINIFKSYVDVCFELWGIDSTVHYSIWVIGHGLFKRSYWQKWCHMHLLRCFFSIFIFYVIFIYYIDKRFLLKNTTPEKFIRNYILDPIGVNWRLIVQNVRYGGLKIWVVSFRV